MRYRLAMLHENGYPVNGEINAICLSTGELCSFDAEDDYSITPLGWGGKIEWHTKLFEAIDDEGKLIGVFVNPSEAVAQAAERFKEYARLPIGVRQMQTFNDETHVWLNGQVVGTLGEWRKIKRWK